MLMLMLMLTLKKSHSRTRSLRNRNVTEKCLMEPLRFSLDPYNRKSSKEKLRISIELTVPGMWFLRVSFRSH